MRRVQERRKEERRRGQEKRGEEKREEENNLLFWEHLLKNQLPRPNSAF